MEVDGLYCGNMGMETDRKVEREGKGKGVGEKYGVEGEDVIGEV